MSGHREVSAVPPVDSTPRSPAPPHVRASAIAAVALGGLIGAPARYGLGVVFPHNPTGHWPVTTFAINIVGAFVLGGLLEALARLGPDSGWRQRARLCVGTGIIGSFTTYSTLAVDTDLLLRGHHPWSAVTYALGTVIVGMVATAAGIGTGAWMTTWREEERR
ncbi:fluoride efflux transporter FluC [Nocardia fluminea]|uniref:Fluoride-specific ion channel FluC n=1 Tax=Nocardia fluminea TaxID=134984 RepID=A0A2N3V510_9NOCA|nr:CrcB family protein [Nocardia fluminea]PKV76681.1 CrcB protein [Nocardia fluminea]